MTRDDVIRMAREADAAHDIVQVTPFLERFAALVAAHEREECAKVAQSLWQVDGQFTADEFAAAIRAKR